MLCLVSINSTGERNLDKHIDFIAMREKQESSSFSSSKTIIVVPVNPGVLLGQARPFQEHIRNTQLSHIMSTMLSLYKASSKPQKTSLAKQILDQIKLDGGRFLKQTDGVWEEVEDVVALKKRSVIPSGRTGQ